MDIEQFQVNAHELVDWMSNYLRGVEQHSVKSQVHPGEIYQQLPATAPAAAEDFHSIMRDVDSILMPGVTHWQHPKFCAYFPANSSPPSILAEMLTATLGLQCMLWETSPAATELEQRMMEWLRQMIGLPEGFTGVLHDTASVSTLCALLNARERVTNYMSNISGLRSLPEMTVYCSTETHSSVEKAIRVIGLGSAQLRSIPVDSAYAMRVDTLRAAILKDLGAGKRPMAIVATIGTTSCAAIDPVQSIAEIAKEFGIWLHVDAAYAGSALIVDEVRWISRGIEHADSIVLNPHKWLMVNFDCSALYVRNVAGLQQTFEIHPEYLKTQQGSKVTDFRNFGIQLGRRFRSLKLWMVIRSYGVEGLQALIRKHLELAARAEAMLRENVAFELMAPRHLALVCFRLKPQGCDDETLIEALNQRLLDLVNRSGELYISHCRLQGKLTLRLSIGQTYIEHQHVEEALGLIFETAKSLIK